MIDKIKELYASLKVYLDSIKGTRGYAIVMTVIVLAMMFTLISLIFMTKWFAPLLTILILGEFTYLTYCGFRNKE